MKKIIFFCLMAVGMINCSCAQKKDTAKGKDNAPHIYFIITAGTEINAYYNDKPVEVSTVEDFNKYVDANAKTMRDSWVVVTGKPKTGTYDEVMRTLKRNRFKHISTNLKDL